MSAPSDRIEQAFEKWWAPFKKKGGPIWDRRTALKAWAARGAADAKLVRAAIQCGCKGFCECYGRSTIERIARAIEEGA